MTSVAALLLVIIVAILPVAGLAYLIYRADRYDPEGRIPVSWSLFLGALLFLPALLSQRFLLEITGDAAGLVSTALVAFIVSAGIEESLKTIGVWVYPYQRSFFNEPMDGIVYAGMIGMGFALAENLYQVITGAWRVLPFRALTTVPAHAIISVILGYFIGRARFSEGQSRSWWLRGWLAAVLLHGLYNFILLQKAYDWLLLLTPILLGLGALLAYDLIRRHQEGSPFRTE